MKILDALGDVLEEKVSVVKIDVVLGIQFVGEVLRGCPRESITLKYKQDYNIDIYSHDIARAAHINRLHQLHVFDHEKNMALPIDYCNDTLSVMYEWVGRHKLVFMGGHRCDAFRLFRLLCESYRCQSVLQMPEDDCDFLFNYIWLRDFIDHSSLS